MPEKLPAVFSVETTQRADDILTPGAGATNWESDYEN